MAAVSEIGLPAVEHNSILDFSFIGNQLYLNSGDYHAVIRRNALKLANNKYSKMIFNQFGYGHAMRRLLARATKSMQTRGKSTTTTTTRLSSIEYQIRYCCSYPRHTCPVDQNRVNVTGDGRHIGQRPTEPATVHGTANTLDASASTAF